MDTRAEQLDGGLSLEELAQGIRHEHAEAERMARESVEHARAAGQMLVIAKGLVKQAGGSWMAWVATNCPFSHATANLYMKIAREWSKLDSERVRNLSLRDTARLVYGAETDLSEDDVPGEGDRAILQHLGITPADLADLSAKQRQVLAQEVIELYDEFCEESYAEPLPAGEDVPAVLLDRRCVVWLVRRAISDLAKGLIGHKKIRERLRPLGDQEYMTTGTSGRWRMRDGLMASTRAKSLRDYEN